MVKTRYDRRTSLRLAAAAATASVFATRPQLAQARQGRLIAPPAGRMLYRRQVARALADGRVFSVTRSFTVEFVEMEDGYTLTGRQQSVSVDAPEALARFAQLERERDESGLFPLTLDRYGHIRWTETGILGRDEVEAAMEQALAAFARAGAPQSEREQMERFIAAIHAAGQGITATLPRDLFAPAEGARRTQQSLPLQEGLSGLVETVFDSELDRETGLMRAATREIVTAIEDSRRTTSERWSLIPLD